MTIDALDVLYLPSRDEAADLAFYHYTPGARVVFVIEAMGTRVAEVALAPEGPGSCSRGTSRATRRCC